MKNTLKISLKPNEKIYINGAVLRVDRKVSIELLNDVQFLLENHVLQGRRLRRHFVSSTSSCRSC